MKKKHLLHSIQHFLIGAALVIKGYDKYHHHYYMLGALIFSFGIIALLYFLYMVLKRDDNRKMNILIHLFEALVSLFTAYVFYREGTAYLHYVSLIAAIGFLIAAYVAIKRPAKAH